MGKAGCLRQAACLPPAVEAGRKGSPSGCPWKGSPGQLTVVPGCSCTIAELRVGGAQPLCTVHVLSETLQTFTMSLSVLVLQNQLLDAGEEAPSTTGSGAPRTVPSAADILHMCQLCQYWSQDPTALLHRQSPSLRNGSSGVGPGSASTAEWGKPQNRQTLRTA